MATDERWSLLDHWKLVRHASRNAALPPPALPVLIAVIDHCHNGTDTSFPGLERLEAVTNLRRRSVIRGVLALETNGYLTVDRTGRSNRYTVNFSIGANSGTGDKTGTDPEPPTGANPVPTGAKSDATGAKFGPRLVSVSAPKQAFELSSEKASEKSESTPSAEPEVFEEVSQAEAKAGDLLPDWLPSNAAAWFKRKRYNPEQMAVELKRMERWNGEGFDLEQVIDEAIVNDFKSLYPKDHHRKDERGLGLAGLMEARFARKSRQMRGAEGIYSGGNQEPAVLFDLAEVNQREWSREGAREETAEERAHMAEQLRRGEITADEMNAMLEAPRFTALAQWEAQQSEEAARQREAAERARDRQARAEKRAWIRQQAHLGAITPEEMERQLEETGLSPSYVRAVAGGGA